MNVEDLRSLLNKVRSGDIPVDTALEELKHLPYQDMGFAKLDHHRHIRTGFPEVVFCQGKTCEQVAEIVEKLAGRSPKVLASRASKEQYAAVQERISGDVVYHEAARMIVVDTSEDKAPETDKYIM